MVSCIYRFVLSYEVAHSFLGLDNGNGVSPVWAMPPMPLYALAGAVLMPFRNK
ncbi:hypothetical protein N9P17_07310 [Tateyamaria sp.]|nr:hypothetical protein [Tateyamaria sp.]